MKPWLDDTIAANGRPVRENFAAWFGASALVDRATGEPKVFYRGEQSGSTHTIFDPAKTREQSFFFTADASVAKDYAHGREPRAFFLRAAKVLDLTDDSREAINFVCGWAKAWTKESWIDRRSGEEIDPWDAVAGGDLFDYEGDWSAERWRDLQASIDAAGYDAAILPDNHHRQLLHSVVVFDPKAIKLATGNSGLYASDSASIDDVELAMRKTAAAGAKRYASIQTPARGKSSNHQRASAPTP